MDTILNCLWCSVPMSFGQLVRLHRLGRAGYVLCHNKLIVHKIVFSRVDSKRWGYHRTLVAYLADHINKVCCFVKHNTSLPQNTQEFNGVCSSFVALHGQPNCCHHAVRSCVLVVTCLQVEFLGNSFQALHGQPNCSFAHDLVPMSLPQLVWLHRLGWDGHVLRHDKLIIHEIIFSRADCKRWGCHWTLVADLVDHINQVCCYDTSLPQNTQEFNGACSSFVAQAGDLGCFKWPSCANPYISESWYQKHLSKCPKPIGVIMGWIEMETENCCQHGHTTMYVQSQSVTVIPESQPNAVTHWG